MNRSDHLTLTEFLEAFTNQHAIDTGAEELILDVGMNTPREDASMSGRLKFTAIILLMEFWRTTTPMAPPKS